MNEVVPSMINGAITALYFILWVKGVKSCGPLRAILAEYSGAVLGVLSAVLYGRRGHMWKKGTAPDSSRELHFATWPYLSTVLFAIILIFYVENIAEERIVNAYSWDLGELHPSSRLPRVIRNASDGACCLPECGLEARIFFRYERRILFVEGIYEATSVERTRQDSHQSPDLSEGPLEDLQMSSLPT
ncbi:hypothetical protein Cgig2_022379 [Carnegiea gigantea]|uniref:Uncharacterized protein n=1 Tax=Carnegiea gigantea TaxID=171969 RepID=A0A9Q1KE46_9CARY|nr:hypothetical protein Cgig2_022379 [Carnegiea gigantea]